MAIRFHGYRPVVTLKEMISGEVGKDLFSTLPDRLREICREEFIEATHDGETRLFNNESKRDTTKEARAREIAREYLRKRNHDSRHKNERDSQS